MITRDDGTVAVIAVHRSTKCCARVRSLTSLSLPTHTDAWDMRCRTLDRFRAAVLRTIYRRRAAKRLRRLNRFLDAASRNKEQLAKMAEKLDKGAVSSAQDMRSTLPDVDIDRVVQSVLPVFRAKRFQPRKEPTALGAGEGG